MQFVLPRLGTDDLVRGALVAMVRVGFAALAFARALQPGAETDAERAPAE